MAVDKKVLLRDVLKLVQTGKLDKAVEAYKAIIKLDPRDAAVHNALGDLFIRQGKKKEAIAEYLEVAGLYEKDGFALRAVAILQKVINIDPEQIAVRIRLGDLYAGQKLAAEGRAQYMHAANYYDRRGEVVNALEIFRKIANLDPGNLPVRLKLAEMFEKQKFSEKAAEEYVRAAKGYADKNEQDTAAQLYVRAFKLAPANDEARRRLADFYARRQEWSVVAGLLETPYNKGSRDTELLLLYAEALSRVSHAKDAARVLEGALEREPNSLPVNLALGRICIKIGAVEKGNAALARCVSVHLAENRLEPAESLLREMAAAAPGEEAILQRLLEVAQKRGEKETIAKVYLDLAALYEKKQLPRSAATALEKYLEIKPGDAEGIRRLALLQERPPAPKVEEPAPAPPPPPAVSRPPVPPPPPAPPPQRPPLEHDDVVEITLEDDEEELFIEEEGEAAAAPSVVAAPALAPAVAAGVEEELFIEEEGESAAAPPVVAPAPAPAVAAGDEEELFIEEEGAPAAAPPVAATPAAESGDEELLIISEEEGEVAVPAAAAGVDLDEEIELVPSREPDIEITGFSDFLAALNQGPEPRPETEPVISEPPQGDEGLTEIFREFQRTVGEQVGDDDFETHYNLGIAYKEMGLLEEAIAELGLAEKSPARGLDALSMIALCLSEMGRFDEAALRMRTGVSLALEGSEAQKGFLYDLAALHEKAGRAAEARETLLRLLAIDAAYRDVAARITAAPAAAPAAGTPSRKKSKVSYL